MAQELNLNKMDFTTTEDIRLLWDQESIRSFMKLTHRDSMERDNGEDAHDSRSLNIATV